jgi:Protein of unknown function (DUF4231)
MSWKWNAWARNLTMFALFLMATSGAVYVFYGSNRFLIVFASLVTAAALYGLRKRDKCLYGAIEVVIGVIAIYDASGKGRGGFSSGFSAGFDVFQWTVVLLQTATAIYLTIRGFDNIEQGWSHRRTKSNQLPPLGGI